ncbi:phage terminase large subunit, partial [Aureimonas altamirensis]|uniref:phage terminase large subunit n=1 Tax=Aureimonas altamirensis TaxID=370622 RepID=UPI002554BFFB
MSTLRINVPRRLIAAAQAIHDPSQMVRFIGLHGGRGGAKSHFFAEQAISRCVNGGARIACLREFQTSTKDSVKQLLSDKIAALGLSLLFEILDTEIRGPHGSLIIFKGLQDFTADRIKSLEGFDVAWIEEAQSITEFSLRMLLPTIRKPGSQIWFSWNPRHDDDAVEKLLRGQHVPSDALVIEVNWQD